MTPENEPKADDVFIHVQPNAELCHGNPPTMKHEFEGWREIDGGRGGEQVCKFCGMGAMEHTLRVGP